MRRVCVTWKKSNRMLVTILKTLLVYSLLMYCVSLNKKYCLGENRSDLQARGAAKMGGEPQYSNLEARLPFLECQMCSEGRYHHPRLSVSDSEQGKGQFMV